MQRSEEGGLCFLWAGFNWLSVYFVVWSCLTELMVKCCHMIWESIFLFPSKPALGLNCQWEPQSNHHCLNRHKHSKRYTIPLPPLHAHPQSISHSALKEGVLSSSQNWTPGLLDLACWKVLEKYSLNERKPFLFYSRVWYFVIKNLKTKPNEPQSAVPSLSSSQPSNIHNLITMDCCCLCPGTTVFCFVLFLPSPWLTSIVLSSEASSGGSVAWGAAWKGGRYARIKQWATLSAITVLKVLQLLQLYMEIESQNTPTLHIEAHHTWLCSNLPVFVICVTSVSDGNDILAA